MTKDADDAETAGASGTFVQVQPIPGSQFLPRLGLCQEVLDFKITQHGHHTPRGEWKIGSLFNNTPGDTPAQAVFG